MGNASNAPLGSRLRLGLPSPPLLCRTPILRSARRFCRNPSPGGASDSSPVREHWERLLSPRAGAGNFAIRTQARALGSLSPSGLRERFLVAVPPVCGAANSGCEPAFQRAQPGAARSGRAAASPLVAAPPLCITPL